MKTLIEKCRKHKNFILAFFVLFVSVLKIFFMLNFAYKSDIINYHYNWCKYISQHNIFSIYSSEATTGLLSYFPINYPPIFLFLLWPISGLATSVFDSGNLPLYYFLVKLPIILINTGFSVYLYKKINKAFGVFWYCNPLFLFDSEIWGQTDTLLCMVIVLFVLAITKHEYIKSSIFFAIGCLLKLQMCYLFPVLLALLFKSKSVKNVLQSLIIGGTVGILGWLPFIIYNKDLLTPIRLYLGGVASQKSLAYNSTNVYSLWPNVQIENANVFGIPISFINALVLITIMIVSFVLLFNAKTIEKEVAYICFYLFSIYMFTLSQHERYIIPTIVLFSILVFLHNKKYLLPFIVSSLSAILCLFVVYIGDLALWKQNGWIPSVLDSTMFKSAFLLSVFSYSYFVYITFIKEKLVKNRREVGAAK